MITDCYTDDWQRTNPDFVVYLPKTGNGFDGYADRKHFAFGRIIPDEWLADMVVS